MRTELAYLVLAAAALGQTPASADQQPDKTAFSAEERLKLENAQLRLRLAQKDAAEAQAAGQAVFAARCAAAGIEQEKCVLAASGLGVAAKPESPPALPKAQPKENK